MEPITILAVGFVLGLLVMGLSLLALVGRHKFENMRLKIAMEATIGRVRQTEKRNALLHKNLLDANDANAQLKGDVERLRHEKLKAWDIPGGM